RSHFHPGGQVRYVLIAEFALRRHLETLVAAAHRLNEQARLRLPRHDGRTGIPALQQMVAGIELQASQLGVSMAGEAVLAQHWTDARLKKLPWLLRGQKARQGEQGD